MILAGLVLAVSAFASPPALRPPVHGGLEAGVPALADASALGERLRGEEEVAALAKEAAARGEPFDGIFRAACSWARGRSGAGRLVFGGLKRWTERGGAPLLQQRNDLALHLIFGGWLGATLGVPAARIAAHQKEVQDAWEPGNAFDLDDLAAGVAGAELAVRLTRQPTLLDAWAHGHRSLEGLPRLELGKLAPRASGGAAEWRRVNRWVADALR